MWPDNPSNDNPFIFRILDSLGIAHLVAPLNHEHSKSEIVGLESSLAIVAKEISKTSGDQYALVRCESKNNNAQILLNITDTGDLEYERYAIITWQNMPNLQRALADPDSVPTASSDNLVTSGGVKTALDGKQNTLTFDTTPTTGSTNPVTSGGVKTALDVKAAKTNTNVTYFTKSFAQDKIDLKYIFEDEHDQSTFILENHSQDAYKVSDFFETGDEDAIILYPSTELPSVAEDGFAVVRVLRYYYAGDLKYFVIPESYYDSL